MRAAVARLGDKQPPVLAEGEVAGIVQARYDRTD
jgi:hypothetical protein